MIKIYISYLKSLENTKVEENENSRESKTIECDIKQYASSIHNDHDEDEIQIPEIVNECVDTHLSESLEKLRHDMKEFEVIFLL